jgi:N-acetylglutamate synthase-like GNAT family acetyltransferase
VKNIVQKAQIVYGGNSFLLPHLLFLQHIHTNPSIHGQKMKITYSFESIPSAEQVIELYNNAGLPRPTDDRDRIRKMYENSDLIVTAWDNELLVGVSRCITDWVWSCYLADLAIRQDYKKSGIGRQLVDLTKEKLGEQSMILLLSVPTAMEYYPKLGFLKEDRGFLMPRKK